MTETLEKIPDNIEEIRFFGDNEYEGYIVITQQEFVSNKKTEKLINEKMPKLTSQGFFPKKLYLKYEVPGVAYIYALQMGKRI